MPHIVHIEDDFDMEKIRTSGQCFRIARLDDGAYRAIAGDKVLYMRKAGSACADEVGVDGGCEADEAVEGAEGGTQWEVSCTPEEWGSFWSAYFDLGRDYSAIRKACEGRNAFVDEAMAYGRGLRILAQDPWEMLITFIVSQRKNMPAIASAVEQLAQRFGSPVETERGTVYAFPTPEQLAAASEDDLRACSLGYRAPYIAETTRQVLSGELDLGSLAKADDAALFEGLQEARGVGAKVANCVCLFGYGRTSQVPVDVWIARAIDEECGGVDPFAQFGEDAGIMQQYVFYYMTDRRK